MAGTERSGVSVRHGRMLGVCLLSGYYEYCCYECAQLFRKYRLSCLSDVEPGAECWL